MITTTDFGTWNNHGDHSNSTVGATVLDYIGGGDSDWFERVQESGALDRMVQAYRDAINNALPDGVYLSGDLFYGPYYAEDYTWTGDLDIAEVIEGIDLAAIVEEHDPDNWTIEQVAEAIGAASTGSARRTLSRWGVKANSYRRGENGRPQARYYGPAVERARDSRPGRGARTDRAQADE